METETGDSPIIPQAPEGLFKTLLSIILYPNHSFHYLMFTSFCMGIQYYSLTFFIPLYFSLEFGYTDLQSGLIFGVFGTFVGIFSIIFSYFIYQVSLKRGLILSSVLGFIGFILLILDERYSSLLGICFEAASCSLAWPYLEYGIKEYSSSVQRSMCSTLYFISIYAAGIVSGVMIESLNQMLSNYTEIFVFIYGMCILALVLAFWAILKCSDTFMSEAEVVPVKEIVRDKKFVKYTLLIIIITLIRSACFEHFDATLPKYTQRIYGQHAKFGSLITLHSILMILSAFICTKFTSCFSNYTLIVIGCGIGILGCLPLAFSNHYSCFICLVIGTAIGESILIPRLLDYTYAVATKKQLAVYLAMSSLPFYFSMLITGATSGVLLETFCPSNLQTCNYIWKVCFLSSSLVFLCFICSKIIIISDYSDYSTIEMQKFEDSPQA